jgi:hypothetical protein
MSELLSWLEAAALGGVLRNSGVWVYGILNLGHVLGVSMLVGSIVALDLRLLGLWRSTPLQAIARPTVPLAAIGFVLAAASGICMISVNATEYIDNPFLLLKFPAIGIGLLNALLLLFLPAWREKGTRELSSREYRQLAVAGGVSLLSWLAALTGGRMLGYW